MKIDSSIFKAYDVRGIYPEQLDEQTATRIGEAYTAVRKPKKIAVGRDVRNSGEGLKKALIASLLKSGVDVVDIGTITTDQLYFTVGNYGYDGGISVTASHNPSQYNGFKFIGKGSEVLSSKELLDIRDWAASEQKITNAQPGKLSSRVIIPAYIKHALSSVDVATIKPIRVVANANFGAVGRSIDLLAKHMPLDINRLNWQQDGTFPKGPPNPSLLANRAETIAAIKQSGADLGVAWDADADRCFFFTGEGKFVPSCFIISLLAQEFLKKYPGSKIVYDLTSTWAIRDTVKRAGGKPISSRVGHTFIKAKMRAVDAPFAAESSGHYLFRDNYYADNGIIPFLLIIDLISKSGKSLAELIAPLASHYFVADETNFEVADSHKTIQKFENMLGQEGKIDKTDGLTIEAKDWRINIRPSNTEPLIRLNAEAKSQQALDTIIKKVSTLVK